MVCGVASFMRVLRLELVRSALSLRRSGGTMPILFLEVERVAVESVSMSEKCEWRVCGRSRSCQRKAVQAVAAHLSGDVNGYLSGIRRAIAAINAESGLRPEFLRRNLK